MWCVEFVLVLSILLGFILFGVTIQLLVVAIFFTHIFGSFHTTHTENLQKSAMLRGSPMFVIIKMSIATINRKVRMRERSIWAVKRQSVTVVLVREEYRSRYLPSASNSLCGKPAAMHRTTSGSTQYGGLVVQTIQYGGWLFKRFV